MDIPGKKLLVLQKITNLIQNVINVDQLSDDLYNKLESEIDTLSELVKCDYGMTVSIAESFNEDSVACDKQQIEIKVDLQEKSLDSNPRVFSPQIVDIVDKFNSPYKDSFINDDFKKAVFAKERSTCIGFLLTEDLWDPESNTDLKTMNYFIDIVSTLLKYFPEIIVPFDDEREINENEDSWNTAYFEKQKSFLRHNFSKERLAHIILIYKLLIWDKRKMKERKINERKDPILPLPQSPVIEKIPRGDEHLSMQIIPDKERRVNIIRKLYNLLIFCWMSFLKRERKL